MRNLKRALSLTLASVMLLGMMVVGAGTAGFPDVTDEENVEAIEVLQAVEVMAKLLNYDYYEPSCPFWDVPTWAWPYVGLHWRWSGQRRQHHSLYHRYPVRGCQGPN